MLSNNARNLFYMIKDNMFIFESDNFDVDALAMSEKRKIDDYFNELVEENYIKSYTKEIAYNEVKRPMQIIYKVVK